MPTRRHVLAAVTAMALCGPSCLLARSIIDIPAPAVAESFEHEIMLDERSVRLVLEANRAPFRHLEASVLSDIHAAGNRFFRGVLAGVEGSWVRLSWVDGAWSGALFDGEELMFLDRAPSIAARGAGALRAASGAALYRLSELESDGIDFIDPTESGDHAPQLPVRVGLMPKARSQGDHGRLPVTIVTDTQFSSKHGSNALAVVASRINTVDGVLSAEVGTGLSLTHHQILASNGPLTASNCFDLRQQFQDFFMDGSGSSIPFAGVAHLFTGRQLPGTVGCVTSTSFGPCTRAFSLGVVMDMAQEWQSVAVFAHEIGHNLGAPHDGEPGSACAHEAPGRIMAPNGGTALTYSSCSVGLIQQRLEQASCLIQFGIFGDSFETR